MRRTSTPVFLPPADGRAAISTGSVDAWVIWDPFLAEAQQDPTLRTLSDASAATERRLHTGAARLRHRPSGYRHDHVARDQGRCWLGGA
ncbi:MAG: hypothetical protein WDN04_18555 [Rhodospirillales bacterium]